MLASSHYVFPLTTVANVAKLTFHYKVILTTSWCQSGSDVWLLTFKEALIIYFIFVVPGLLKPGEEAVHTKTQMYCIVWTDGPSTRILSTHFLESGSQGGKIQKRSPPVLVWTANSHTFPPLDLWTPQQQQQRRTTACVRVSCNLLAL